jgi:hypothetical protein
VSCALAGETGRERVAGALTVRAKALPRLDTEASASIAVAASATPLVKSAFALAGAVRVGREVTASVTTL